MHRQPTGFIFIDETSVKTNITPLRGRNLIHSVIPLSLSRAYDAGSQRCAPIGNPRRVTLAEYVGLDVSKEATSFWVKDAEGKVLARGKVATAPRRCSRC